MHGDDLCFSTASELARAIDRGDASSSDVVERHLSRIETINGRFNAIVTLDAEQARRRAREADAARARGERWGPLHGVPVTLKDSLETARLRTTAGTRALADHVPGEDATVVSRVRAAGAIVLGKTNLAEMASDIQCDNPVFGRTDNPWDTTRTSGGSTGGGAVSVATGMSPLEIGSDLAGSIRIPSHFCGVFGMKPSEHLVSLAGHIPEPPGEPRGVRHLGTIGPLARSVEDLALALRLIAGPDGRDWSVPPVAIAEAPRRKPSELRLAWTDGLPGVAVDRETREALGRLAEELGKAGATVERRDPPGFDLERAWQAYAGVLGAELGASMPAALRLLAPLVALVSYRRDRLGRRMIRNIRSSARRYARALTTRDELTSNLERFLGDWDGWLCPVTSTPAFTHRRSGVGVPSPPIEVDGERVPYWMAAAGHTTLFNLTGSPVVVLPLAMSSTGLPIGVQLVGRRWCDGELLAVAEALATVTKPFAPPPIRADQGT